MMAAHWDELYGRPALSRDAALFILALALHLPLLLLQMKAPAKRGSPSYQKINITYIESQRNLIERPAVRVVPPKATVDLRAALREMGINPNPLPVPEPVAPPPDLTGLKAALVPPPSGAIPSPVSANIPLTTASPMSPLTPAVGASGTSRADKGTFAVAPGEMASLTPPTPLAGPRSAETIVIQTGEEWPSPLPLPEARAPRVARVAPAALESKNNAPPAVVRGHIPPPSIGEPVKVAPVEAPPATMIHPTPGTERILSGIPITGPLANRAVRYQEIPDYPEWARARGIEATIKLIFKVGPDGRVKNDIMVETGSGEPRLDRHAINAVLRWVFEPLPESEGNREDVGTVVFRFTMK